MITIGGVPAPSQPGQGTASTNPIPIAATTLSTAGGVITSLGAVISFPRVSGGAPAYAISCYGVYMCAGRHTVVAQFWSFSMPGVRPTSRDPRHIYISGSSTSIVGAPSN